MPRSWDEKLGDEFTKKVQDEVANDIKSFRENPVKWLKDEGHLCSVDKIFVDQECPDHEGLPDIWSNFYESEKQKAIDIDNDTLYVMLVSGILKMAIKSLKEKSEKKRKCHPMVIAAALVTEDHLKKAKNPMKVALKVRAAIRNVWGKRSRALYSEVYEEDIRKTPRVFAEKLLKKCVSLQETAALIDVTDVEVLTALSEGKFRRVTQDYAFKKLTRDRVFWGTRCYESDWRFFLIDCPIRFGLVLFWNMLYFLEVITCGCVQFKRLNEQRKMLFSPVSCFFADILNYIIMVLIIGIVLMQKGAGIAQESTVELTRQYIQGNISIEDEPRLINGSTPGITLVELEKNPMSFFGFLLALCLVSRTITELLQLFDRDVFLAVPKKLRGGIVSYPMLKQIRKRFKIYIHSDMNKIDLLLMCILTLALCIDIHYSFFSKAVYGRICATEECDEELDYSLEARRVIYMINLYSIAVLLSMVRLFYCLFEYVSIIGPMLRSMQLMIKVLIILVFLSIGFFIPLLKITRTYRSVAITSKIKSEIVSEDDDDDETFKSMESFHGGIYTMIFSLMDGQLSNADDVYMSKDQSVNVFLFIIVISYFLAVGLLCFNLLIALVTKRYDTTVENKNREWEFSKYQLIMNYLCLDETAAADETRNDGMPFIFPFTFLYIPPRLLARICGKKVKDCAIKGKKITYSCVEAGEGKDSGGAENGGEAPKETSDLHMMKMLVEREPPKKEEDKNEDDENPAV